jgi:hypothetical protein
MNGAPLPRRLWSLWEMFELKASAFHQAATQIASTSAWVGASSYVQNEEPTSRTFHENENLDIHDLRFLRGRLEALREHLDALGARVTLLAVNEAIDNLRSPEATWGHAKIRLDEISNTLRRELTSATILSLETREQAYYAPHAPLFGSDVSTKFASAGAFEIEEAAKCLALGRSTASVFHLMRIMEIAIRAVARCLGIPDPIKPAERNWGKILNAIKDDLDAHGGRSPSKNWTQANDEEFFAGAYASLDAVRVAWRNPTMHVENKYADTEAEHIFIAVKGFMMKLASRCDENGSPRA